MSKPYWNVECDEGQHRFVHECVASAHIHKDSAHQPKNEGAPVRIYKRCSHVAATREGVSHLGKCSLAPIIEAPTL